MPLFARENRHRGREGSHAKRRSFPKPDFDCKFVLLTIDRLSGRRQKSAMFDRQLSVCSTLKSRVLCVSGVEDDGLNRSDIDGLNGD